jgi:hypothetical protein
MVDGRPVHLVLHSSPGNFEIGITSSLSDEPSFYVLQVLTSLFS